MVEAWKKSGGKKIVLDTPLVKERTLKLGK